MFNRYIEEINLDYFTLKENDKVIKNLGAGYYQFFLIEKSLFSFFVETRNLLFILFIYLFVILFNTYLTAIVPNPVEYNENAELDPNQNLFNFSNFLNDYAFTYANSFLYITIWYIEYIRKKIIAELEYRQNNINKYLDDFKQKVEDKINYWKQQDDDNTYCQQCCCSCTKGSCCCDCDLVHYLESWDNLKDDFENLFTTLKNNINDELNQHKEYINNAFNFLKNIIIQIFQIRLYWTFLLLIFFVKFPFLAIKRVRYEERKKRIYKEHLALLMISKYKKIDYDFIIQKISYKMKVSEKAAYMYLYRLKKNDLIRIIKKGAKKYIEITEKGLKRVEYIKKILESEKNENKNK